MKTIIQCINESSMEKLKDVYSEVKKLCGKAKFFWEPSEWSVAFKWKDDDYIVVKRPRGLRSQRYVLIDDYDGDIDIAIDDITDIFENKDHFLKVNCKHYLEDDVDTLNIKDYVICRVRPERIYAICKIMKNGKASVYGNDSVEWTLDKFDLDKETFENYKQMRQKANEKLIKEQTKRFDKKDKGFRIVLWINNNRYVEFSFDGMQVKYGEKLIPLSNRKSIKNKIEEFVK